MSITTRIKWNLQGNIVYRIYTLFTPDIHSILFSLGLIHFSTGSFVWMNRFSILVLIEIKWMVHVRQNTYDIRFGLRCDRISRFRYTFYVGSYGQIEHGWWPSYNRFYTRSDLNTDRKRYPFRSTFITVYSLDQTTIQHFGIPSVDDFNVNSRVRGKAVCNHFHADLSSLILVIFGEVHDATSTDCCYLSRRIVAIFGRHLVSRCCALPQS